jgi:hypothetical protein
MVAAAPYEFHSDDGALQHERVDANANAVTEIDTFW